MAKTFFTLDTPVWSIGKYKGQNKTIRDILRLGDHNYLEWARKNVEWAEFDPEIHALIDSGRIPELAPGVLAKVNEPVAPPPVPSNHEPVQLSLDVVKTMKEAFNALQQCVVMHPMLGKVLIIAPAENLEEPLSRGVALMQELETCFRAGQSCTFKVLPEDVTAPGNKASAYPTTPVSSVPATFAGDPFGPEPNDDLPF